MVRGRKAALGAGCHRHGQGARRGLRGHRRGPLHGPRVPGIRRRVPQAHRGPYLGRRPAVVRGRPEGARGPAGRETDREGARAWTFAEGRARVRAEKQSHDPRGPRPRLPARGRVRGPARRPVVPAARARSRPTDRPHGDGARGHRLLHHADEGRFRGRPDAVRPAVHDLRRRPRGDGGAFRVDC